MVCSWFFVILKTPSLKGNYYIAFVILSDSMEGNGFHIAGIKTINLVLNYFYLGLLVMCFILSLGNRPQGSKIAYTLAMVGFALVTVYMTTAAILLSVKGIENVRDSKGALKVSDIFSDPIFRNIVLSLLATLGLYLISSLIFVRAHCHSLCPP